MVNYGKERDDRWKWPERRVAETEEEDADPQFSKKDSIQFITIYLPQVYHVYTKPTYNQPLTLFKAQLN